MATVVAFHAHPDDEVLLTGGTLAKLAAEGHRVVVVVACDEAVWANEIELMGPDLVLAINAALGAAALTGLTCRADAGATSRRTRRRKQK